jgi:type II secretory ATPase GspE/PulE/Tfp pilus assembly ATPase PilB-like protein
MPSPSDRPGKSTSNLYDLVLSHFSDDLMGRLNVDQMFILIDGVLPFEACLYHQVLPLYLEGSRLHLGMVTSDDQAAIEYARRIISYLNYSLVTHPIASAALQAVLSAYLNQAANRQAAKASSTPSDEHPLQETIEIENPKRSELSDRQTLIVDRPDDLQDSASSDAESPNAASSEPPSAPASSASPQSEPAVSRTPSPAPTTAPTKSSKSNKSTDYSISAARQAAIFNSLPELTISSKYRDRPLDTLLSLSPKPLLHELLGRILDSGIGRIYFERQSRYGRVLWSQNGILQAVVERLDLQLFQGLIYELKLMGHLPLDPSEVPEQSEIERMYQENRILLRFRVMPSKNGEEATVQVLRGAALKFYQQQQFSRLGRDALSIAKQLQFKVNEIRERAFSEPGLMQARIEALASLSEMLRVIESQIDDLQGAGLDDPEDNLIQNDEP